LQVSTESCPAQPLQASGAVGCHPEQEFFAQRKPALSVVEGDPTTLNLSKNVSENFLVERVVENLAVS
jgi:hypothetical protein